MSPTCRAPSSPRPTTTAATARSPEPYYGRYANPTWERWESALGELERGRAIAFASGMAAISAVLLTTLGPGDVLVAPADGYYTVRTLAREHLEPGGVEVRLVPTDDAAVRGALAGATLVWLESPSNPLLDVVDVAAIAALAHEAGALVAVDNTLATPLRQRPLALGADFSVASAAEAQLTGHSDLLLGHVAVSEGRSRRAGPHMAHDDGRDSRPVRDLARAPLACDARPARGAPGAHGRRAERDARSA